MLFCYPIILNPLYHIFFHYFLFFSLCKNLYILLTELYLIFHFTTILLTIRKYLSNINKYLLTINFIGDIFQLSFRNKRVQFLHGGLFMNRKLTVFTKILLDFLYYAGIIVTILVPLIISWYGNYNSYFGNNVISLSVIFILSGILAVLIIRELRKMFRSVLDDNCFIPENVTSLRKMGTYSFCIAIITCCRLFLYMTPAVLIVILVFVIAGLFSKVLSQVFQTAVNYKQENDLTI